MKELINQQIKTMSSREISDLTGKEHRNVKRDVLMMLNQLNLDALKFEHIYFDGSNREQTEYKLDRELSLCLVAGYSAPLRLAIIRRWEQLEQEANKPLNLNDPAALRAALLGYTEQVIQLEQKVEVLEPKAKALDRLCDATALINIRDAAKVLKVKERRFVEFLIEKKIVYRTASKEIRAYESSTTAGLVKSVQVKDFIGEPRTHVKLTEKLLTKVSRWLEKGNKI